MGWRGNEQAGRGARLQARAEFGLSISRSLLVLSPLVPQGVANFDPIESLTHVLAGFVPAEPRDLKHIARLFEPPRNKLGRDGLKNG